MTIYNFYVYNRDGKCIFYREWQRHHNPLGDNTDEDQKLIFGLAFSCQQLAQTLSPSTKGQGDFQCFKTSKVRSKVNGKVQLNGYAMHHYETLHGLRFILNTDADAPSMRPVLRYIYSDIYVKHIVRNPLATPGDKIEAPRFAEALENYIQSLRTFK